MVEKIQELDVIDKDLVAVSQYITSQMRHDWYIYSIFHLVFQSFGMDGQQNTITHSLHSVFNIFIPPRQFQPLVYQEPSSCIQPDHGMSYWTSGWARACGFNKKVWVWGLGAWYTAFYDSYCLRRIEQIGWFIGNNVTVNDVMIRNVCQMLKSQSIDLRVEEVRGRCVIYDDTG